MAVARAGHRHRRAIRRSHHDVSREEFGGLGYNGDTLQLRLGAREFDIPFVKTFGDVPVGSPLVFIDSRGRLSFSLNQTNFAKTYNIKPPVDFTIRENKSPGK